MTADASIRRTPLQSRAADLEAGSRPGVVVLAELPIMESLNLRVRTGFEPAAAQALRIAVPPPLCAASTGGASTDDELHVLWLGPDEFLTVVVGPGNSPVQAGLSEAVSGEAGSVVDVSANRAMLSLRGPRARDVLEKGIQIDLSNLPSGGGQTWCSQTLLAGVPTILWARAEQDWALLVRPSFANYIADWLLDAMVEFTL